MATAIQRVAWSDFKEYVDIGVFFLNRIVLPSHSEIETQETLDQYLQAARTLANSLI